MGVMTYKVDMLTYGEFHIHPFHHNFHVVSCGEVSEFVDDVIVGGDVESSDKKK
jgi:Fe2+ or Zn2+ uptake regulation protein